MFTRLRREWFERSVRPSSGFAAETAVSEVGSAAVFVTCHQPPSSRGLTRNSRGRTWPTDGLNDRRQGFCGRPAWLSAAVAVNSRRNVCCSKRWDGATAPKESRGTPAVVLAETNTRLGESFNLIGRLASKIPYRQSMLSGYQRSSPVIAFTCFFTAPPVFPASCFT